MYRWYDSNGRKWRWTKEPLDKSGKESEKSALKLNINKTKIIASCPITSWQMEEEKVEEVTDFIFLGSKKRPLWMETSAMKLKDTCSLEGKLWQTYDSES